MSKHLDRIQAVLENYISEEGSTFHISADDSQDSSMLSIIHDDLEEFPIFAVASDSQILFNVVLFDKAQVLEGQIAALNETMLQLNIALPLSSFALTGNNYSIFGAMSVNSEYNQIKEEVTVLAENVMDALEVCQEFLIKA